MKKALTLVISLMLVLACTFSLAACGVNDLADVQEDGKLLVATNAEFAPFESKEGSEYVGIDIEIAEYIADELGVELVIKNMDFDAVVTSVQKGQADLALAALTISEKRKKAINFSDAYFGAAQYIVVKSTDTTFDDCTTKEQIDAKLATLSGKTTAQQGTTGYYYIAGNADFGFNGFTNLNATSFDNPVSAAAEVKAGRALFAVVDDEVAKSLVAADAELKYINIALSSEEYGIGVNKKAPKLLEKVNEILAEMKTNGKLAEIFAKHTAA